MKQFDTRISKMLQQRLSPLMPMWVFFSEYGIWGFVALSIFSFFAFEIEWMIYGKVLGSVFLTVLVTLVLRSIIQRPRPTSFQTDYRAWLKSSFPSLHASSSFSAATALSILYYDELFTGEWGVLLIAVIVGLFVLAKLIALSRIVVGVHYYSDVLVGGLLGFLLSFYFMTV